MIKKEDKVKLKGQIYTPNHIVCNVLDLAGYTNNISQKHVMENSCGDGAFLMEIVARYCKQFGGSDKKVLKQELETYIHGIEIDKQGCDKCIQNLNKVVFNFGLENVKWDVKNNDAIMVDEYNGKMDFVLGNPPYVRVHNLGNNFNNVKKFSYAQQGMTDLFIVFYELGLKMLNNTGKLGYITPNSFFNSVAGTYMREQFVSKNNISKIADLKHYQPFDSTTYTAIVILENDKKDNYIEYYNYNENTKSPTFVEKLTPLDFYINKNFYFSYKNNLDLLKEILNNKTKNKFLVKNGYATLCDDVFIDEFPFDSIYIRPAIKASKGIEKRIIYPYDEKGNVIEEDILKQDENLYGYLLRNKSKLLKRSNEKSKQNRWYSFGRSQALSDTFKDKLSINTLIKTVNDIKLVFAPSGTGVYGGLYIITEKTYIDRIKEVLLSDDFVAYISLLGKYKSGGYYTYSSKDLVAFLNYKLKDIGG